jgi:hypothetical protein
MVKVPSPDGGVTSEMQAAARRTTRIACTIAVASAHFYLGMIGLFDRLNYSRPTPYALIEAAANQQTWVFIHLTLAVLLLVGLWHDRGWEWRVCSASAGFMGGWAFFNLLWGLSTPVPVSLAAPGLAAFVAFGAHVLSVTWLRASKERHNKGR